MIVIDTQQTGAPYHFALEQYLCEQKRFDDTVFFLWQTPPTVMLGNFQNSFQEVNAEAAAADGVAVTRRLTGGGTIYTDMNSFQFSFIKKGVSETIDFSRYLDIIVAALGKLGVTAVYNSRNDLTIEGRKVSGNAQSARAGYTLHHGSLLYHVDFSKMTRYLTPPPYKLVSKGITSVRERTANIRDFLPEKQSAADFYHTLMDLIIAENDVATYRLTADDQQQVKQLAEEKFCSWDWTYGKNPHFNLQKLKKCPGGWLDIQLSVTRGMIEACQLSGDFFALHDVSLLQDALKGVPFEQSAVEAALAPELFSRAGLYQITKNDVIDCLFSADDQPV
ncbi:lipoate--protein ligase [Vagococcus acidifermentans]|uniref:lipoate--protein ligase n=1 Tax=Vagococcus acidifermentans TaxID=564710 RepID=A0A430B2V9_9ENTE|nr:lipoate--protein ligase [Vagococcus acidifermentans]RSU14571.1 hypothetical protein CBF27_00885 [Vagococcus acidifermentans]